MPHFDLLKDRNLDPVNECYFRSAIHLIQAKKLIEDGELQHGIAVLYDSLLNAAKFQLYKEGKTPQGTDEAIMRSVRNHLPSWFSFETFQKEMEQALDEKIENLDIEERYREISEIIIKLGIENEGSIKNIKKMLDDLFLSA